MNAEIQFGQLEHSQPEPGLRPDQDKHFAVADCGMVQEHDLPIYVDMDVLRDMESHARENTRVELGGVMLGRQHLDDEGNPFVVITDSLRAKHYEATKGSFKFTHETWNQITRDRNEYRGDLELVGWYHTHPGWGVFLSGMDSFICNNFFSRPLDVALVIDPCAGDRGWFQWDNGKTRETSGFYLITNRHRQSELNYFSEIFSNHNPTIPDPRFRQNAFSEHNSELGESIMNIVDNRRPVFEFAIVSMLFLQLLVAGLLGWKLIAGNPTTESSELADRVASIESALVSDQMQQQATIREQTFSEILNRLVSAETGQPGLADHYADVASQNRMLSENLEGQLARIEKFNNEKNKLAYDLRAERMRSNKLAEDLGQSRLSVQELSEQNEQLRLASQDLAAAESGDSLSKYFPPWLLYTCGGIGLFVLGLLGGSLVNRMKQQNEDDDMGIVDESGDRYSEPNSSQPADVTFSKETAPDIPREPDLKQKPTKTTG